MKRKKLFFVPMLMLLFAFCILAMVSCGKTGGATYQPQPVQLSTPIVVVEDNVATWESDALADKFEVSINEKIFYVENTVTSRCLLDGDTFKIRAIGDEASYKTSEWSNVVTYTAPMIPPQKSNSYTIVWKNGDTVLETDVDVAEGTYPVYNGETPVKEADAQYSYEFAGWTPSVIAASADVIYEAKFTPVLNTYTVVWKNGDFVLETDVNAIYGSMPLYDGKTPAKAAEEGAIYTFIGWSPEISNIVGDATYIAQFEKILIFDIEYSNLFDATYPELIQYQSPIGVKNTEMPHPERVGYTFEGWYTDSECSEGSKVTEIPAGSNQSYHLFASWSVISYTITYIDGSTGDNPTSYTIETETFEMKNPFKEDYVFANWVDVNGDIVTHISQGSSGDIELIAQWLSYEECRVTYDSGYEAKKIDATYTYDYDYFDISLLVPFMKTGYKLQFDLSVYMWEEDEGYQEIYLVNGNDVQVGSIGDNFAHGGSGKDGKFWNVFAFTVEGEDCTDVMVLRYGAHGAYSDDWYRGQAIVAVTVVKE